MRDAPGPEYLAAQSAACGIGILERQREKILLNSVDNEWLVLAVDRSEQGREIIL